MTLTIAQNRREPESGERLRISLAGYGVVGQALAARLADEPGFEVGAILVRHPDRPRAVAPPVPLTADHAAFLDAPADILVDVLSCDATGARLSRAALSQGVHVVSASKRVVSAHLADLHGCARIGRSRLLYSAAVGGGAPVLESVAAVRAGSGIREIRAVLNGTVNYILDRIHHGLGFGEALRQAREAGFAEADCGADLSGADAAAKLHLVAAEAFDIAPGTLQFAAEPLDAAALDRIKPGGERWVQLASLRRTGANLEAGIRLRRLAELPDLPELPGEWNCALITLESGCVLFCSGPGAGGAATAESIFSDLNRIGGRPQAGAAAASC